MCCSLNIEAETYFVKQSLRFVGGMPYPAALQGMMEMHKNSQEIAQICVGLKPRLRLLHYFDEVMLHPCHLSHGVNLLQKALGVHAHGNVNRLQHIFGLRFCKYVRREVEVLVCLHVCS